MPKPDGSANLTRPSDRRLKQRFFERVYDLAYDGCQILSLLKQFRARNVASAPPDPHRRWVYLATTDFGCR